MTTAPSGLGCLAVANRLMRNLEKPEGEAGSGAGGANSAMSVMPPAAIWLSSSKREMQRSTSGHTSCEGEDGFDSHDMRCEFRMPRCTSTAQWGGAWRITEASICTQLGNSHNLTFNAVCISTRVDIYRSSAHVQVVAVVLGDEQH